MSVEAVFPQDIFTEIVVSIRQIERSALKLGREAPSMHISLSPGGLQKCNYRAEASRDHSPKEGARTINGLSFSVDNDQPEDFKVITSDGL